MADITGVSSTQNTQYQQETQRDTLEANDALGQDAFFKILITQLQNQDPLNPMEDRDFVAQMAEFSSLEKTEKVYSLLEEKLSSNQVIKNSNLIGKEITATVEDIKLKGVVKAVKSQGEQIFAVLDNGSEVDISYINEVKEIDVETDGEIEEKVEEA